MFWDGSQKPPWPMEADMTHSINAQLVGFWPCHFTGLQYMDISPYANHGSVKASFKPAANWISSGDPKLGRVMDMAKVRGGVPAVINLGANPSQAFEVTDAWTCFFFLKMETTTNQSLFGRIDGSSPFNGWEILWASNRIFVQIFKDSASSGLRFESVLGLDLTDKFHSLAFSYDGSKTAAGAEFYMDGAKLVKNVVSMDNLTASILPGADRDLHIGSRDGEANPCDALVGPARLYRRVLTDQEIAELHDKPWLGSYPMGLHPKLR